MVYFLSLNLQVELCLTVSLYIDIPRDEQGALGCGQ